MNSSDSSGDGTQKEGRVLLLFGIIFGIVGILATVFTYLVTSFLILGVLFLVASFPLICLGIFFLMPKPVPEYLNESDESRFERMMIPHSSIFDKAEFKVYGLDTVSMVKRTKMILSNFGFEEFSEQRGSHDHGVNFLVQSESNEIAGSMISLSMIFIQMESSVVKCSIMISSEDIAPVLALMKQLKEVLGPVRCPFCKEVITVSEEMNFEIQGEIKCRNCDTVLTELEHDKISSSLSD